MRVIEYKHILPKQIICKVCGALFEYTPHDVKKHSNQFGDYYYVTCPVCGKWCFVDSVPWRKVE